MARACNPGRRWVQDQPLNKHKSRYSHKRIYSRNCRAEVHETSRLLMTESRVPTAKPARPRSQRPQRTLIVFHRPVLSLLPLPQAGHPPQCLQSSVFSTWHQGAFWKTQMSYHVRVPSPREVLQPWHLPGALSAPPLWPLPFWCIRLLHLPLPNLSASETFFPLLPHHLLLLFSSQETTHCTEMPCLCLSSPLSLYSPAADCLAFLVPSLYRPAAL